MDDLTINLIFILLFTCPGFLIQKFLQYVNEITRPEISDFDKNIWAFFYSFLVLILNFLFFMFTGKGYSYLSQIIGELDSFEFLFKYMMLTGVNSVIAVALVWTMINRVIFEMKKRVVRGRRHSILHSELTVWEDITKGRIDLIPDMSDMCVEIIKDGQVITQGSIQGYSDTTHKDFLLTDVRAVRAYLDRDKRDNMPDDKKMFPKIIGEYYDAESDILIRIYDNENWIKNFGEPAQKEKSDISEG